MENTDENDEITETSTAITEYVPRDNKGRFVLGNKEGFQIGNTLSTGRPPRKSLVTVAAEELDTTKAGKALARQVEEGDHKARETYLERTEGKVADRKNVAGTVIVKVVYEGEEYDAIEQGKDERA